MANEIIGFGSKIEYKIGAGSYTELTNVTKLEHPELTVKMVRWQPLKTDRYEKKKSGTGSLSALRITLNFTQTLFNTLTALVFDDTLTWKLTHSDGAATATFTGAIEKVAVNNLDGDAQVPVEIVIDVAITGTPAFA